MATPASSRYSILMSYKRLAVRGCDVEPHSSTNSDPLVSSTEFSNSSITTSPSTHILTPSFTSMQKVYTSEKPGCTKPVHRTLIASLPVVVMKVGQRKFTTSSTRVNVGSPCSQRLLKYSPCSPRASARDTAMLYVSARGVMYEALYKPLL